MISFLSTLLCVVFYLVMAGVTHGYAKYRWPKKIVRRHNREGYNYDADENEAARAGATVFWPFYWVFIWTFTKANELTFSHIEKVAASQIARNKMRIAEMHSTRLEVEKSNDELVQAEAELDKEISRTL